MLTLSQFIAVTIRVLAGDGIENYLPTMAQPDVETVRVLQGIPATVDHKQAVQTWIVRNGHSQSLLLWRPQR